MTHGINTIAFAERVRALHRRSAAEPSSPALSEALSELEMCVEELKLTEEELRTQNEELALSRRRLEEERFRYQELFNFLPDAYVVTDTEGVIAEANRAAADLFQAAARYLIGKPLGVFVAETELPLFQFCLSKFRHGKRDSPLGWTTYLQPRGGESLSVFVTCNCTKNVRGRMEGLRWLFRDITRTSTPADDPRDADAGRLPTVLQTYPFPMWIVDVETLGFLDVNAAAVRHYGYTRDEFLTLTAEDIRQPDHVARFTALWPTVERGLAYRGETRHRTKHGMVLDVEITSHVTTFNHRPARLIMAIDISERKRMERAVRQSEARLKFAVGAAGFSLLDLDFETGMMQRGLDHDTIFGSDSGTADRSYAWFLAHVHPDDRDSVDRNLRHALVMNTGWSFICRINRTDQQVRYIWAQGGVHREIPGKPARLLGFVRDITDG